MSTLKIKRVVHKGLQVRSRAERHVYTFTQSGFRVSKLFKGIVFVHFLGRGPINHSVFLFLRKGEEGSWVESDLAVHICNPSTPGG